MSAKDIQALNPKPFLLKLLNQEVCIRLKWGLEYRGRLISFDDYMNFQLANAEEYVDGQFKGQLGEMFIRCNNVLWVKGAQPADVVKAEEQPQAMQQDPMTG